MKPELLQVLNEWNQPGLLQHLTSLDETARQALETELLGLDLDFLKFLFRSYQSFQTAGVGSRQIFRTIQPLRDDCCELETARIFHQSSRAERFLSEGKAAVLILAGGMGSRLGHFAPKGTFPITPVTGKSLFQVHCEKLAVLRRHYGVPILTCVMTNRASHAATCAFFEENDFFGLPASDFFFFPQNEIPALNPQNGALYFRSNGQICFGPDGHGGLITAMKSAGAYDFLRRHGVETLNTFHVDNPLVPVLNEQFLDAHLNRKSEMSSLVIEKIDGMELVGNVVRSGADGETLRVVEYLDFPGEFAMETNPAGGLKYWAGSIGVHLIQLDFLERMEAQIRKDPDFLPYHLPLKKITADLGEVWGIKPERFIFDVLPFAKNPVVGRAGNRDEVFTTLKKSPEPVRNHLSELYASWLRRLGAKLPERAVVEIAPGFALDFASLQQRVPEGTVFRDSQIYLNDSK